MTNRKLVRELYEKAAETGQPLAWFEELYARGENLIPWADRIPNPNLVEFFSRPEAPPPSGQRALVVGCGLGDDAEYMQTLGMEVDAFDISETAIDHCKRRFPDSRVNYFAADLLTLDRTGLYDWVIEIYTLQVLPAGLRIRAILKLPTFLRAGGQLLIICRGRDEHDPPGQLPFPLTTLELGPLHLFAEEISFEDYFDEEEPPVRRFRALFERRPVF